MSLVNEDESLLVTSDVVGHGVAELLIQFVITLLGDGGNLLVEFLLVHLDLFFIDVLELIALNLKFPNGHQVLLAS